MVTAELVRRCGELKGELVAFTRASRFARRVTWNDVNRVDHFILQQRLPDGRTMIDLFVAARPDLNENERRIVLGWRKPWRPSSKCASPGRHGRGCRRDR